MKKIIATLLRKKPGIITKINAHNGTIAVKVGDTVNKGTTLINGWMEGKYTGIRYVHARGEIQAKVWYEKSKKKICYNTTERRKTDNLENKYAIKINNFEINLSKKLQNLKFMIQLQKKKKSSYFLIFIYQFLS